MAAAGDHPDAAPAVPTTVVPAGLRGPAGGSGSTSIVVAVIVIFLLFSVGIDLWTDALWFRSVGFDSVFWTRVAATFGLGVAAFVIAAAGLPRQSVAGRTSRPAALSRRRGLAAVAGRPHQRGRPGGRRPTRRSAFRRSVPAATGSATARPSPSKSGTCPTSRRSRAGSSAAIALFIALLIGGALSGAWETVLLYLNRVPFSPTASVTDPIFGRDISFFLFELPFLRLVQGLFNGIVIVALVLTLARYIIGASRGGLVFSTPIRVHLAVLGGLFLLSVAFGYQLDKLELVYSTRGVATGVSFTDQNAQFLAFDVLTIVSGIAGGAARRRSVHADDLAARADDRGLVRRLAGHRPALPGSDPAVHRRARTSSPRKSATSATTSR